MAVLYAAQFQQLRDAVLGVAQWLAALRKANTPCALVSHMPAAHVKVLLTQWPATCLLTVELRTRLFRLWSLFVLLIRANAAKTQQNLKHP